MSNVVSFTLLDRTKTAPACPLSSWLRFRIDAAVPANINARMSHLAESKSAALEYAHAAAGAAAGEHLIAEELLRCEKISNILAIPMSSPTLEG